MLTIVMLPLPIDRATVDLINTSWPATRWFARRYPTKAIASESFTGTDLDHQLLASRLTDILGGMYIVTRLPTGDIFTTAYELAFRRDTRDPWVGSDPHETRRVLDRLFREWTEE